MNTFSRRTLAAMLLLCALPLLWIIAMRFYRPLPEFATLPNAFVDIAHSVAWSRDDRFIAAAGPIINEQGKRQLALRWWKRDEKGSFETFRTNGLADEGGIKSLHFLPLKEDKTPLRLVSLSERGVVRVWNVDNGKCEQRWQPRNDGVNGSIRNVAISPDGQRVACAETINSAWEDNKPPTGRMTIRDLGGRVLQSWPEKQGIVQSVAWSQEGNWLALGSSEGMVTIYDAKTKRQLQRWRAGKKNGSVTLSWADARNPPLTRFTYTRVQQLEFVPGTSLLAMAFESGGKIDLRDVLSGETLPVNYQTSSNGKFTFTDDGRVVAYDFGDIRVQRTLQQTDSSNLQSLDERMRSQRTGGWTIPNSDTPFVFSPDSRQLAARGDDGAIVLWRIDQ